MKHRKYFLITLFIILTVSGRGQEKTINVRVLDEKGYETAARVRITINDSVYLAPEGHEVDFAFTNFGGDVILDNNRRFAYIDGTFSFKVPASTGVRFEIVKGFAYKIYDKSFSASDVSGQLEIRLERWFEFPGKTWYSGDVHVHSIDPETGLLEMKAEDLNVCNILTSDFTTDQENFRGSPEPFSDSMHIVYVNQEYREDRLGHVNFLNLKKLIEPVKTQRQYQFPLNIEGMDRVRAQGGHVSWAHFAAWPGLEGPLAIVLNKVHSVELLSTIEPFSEPTFVSDIVPDLRMNSGLRIWYRLLNCGLNIPATAGTDKMSNWVTVGANRVFAMTDGPFTYQRWIDALEKGQTFISNSPFIFCTIDGQSPGSQINLNGPRAVKITAEVYSQFPLDRLEIIANGLVVGSVTMTKGQSHAKLELSYTPQKSSWIAARAHQFVEGDKDTGVSFMQRRDHGGGPTLLNRYYGTLRPETTFAHTSPVYINVGKQPRRSREDAEYFVAYLNNGIAWLEKSGKFPSEGARKKVLETFKRGSDLFHQLAR